MSNRYNDVSWCTCIRNMFKIDNTISFDVKKVKKLIHNENVCYASKKLLQNNFVQRQNAGYTCDVWVTQSWSWHFKSNTRYKLGFCDRVWYWWEVNRLDLSLIDPDNDFLGVPRVLPSSVYQVTVHMSLQQSLSVCASYWFTGQWISCFRSKKSCCRRMIVSTKLFHCGINFPETWTWCRVEHCVDCCSLWQK